MKKQIEKQILIFTEALGYVEDAHIDHGTVYANFKNKEDAMLKNGNFGKQMEKMFMLSTLWMTIIFHTMLM